MFPIVASVAVASPLSFEPAVVEPVATAPLDSRPASEAVPREGHARALPASTVQLQAPGPSLGRRSAPEPTPEARSEDMAVEIEVLGAAHAGAFQALRLEGLERCPCAFRHAHEEEAGQALDEVARRLEDELIVGAFERGELVGVAGLRFDPLLKKRHKGTLFGVYVCAGARGAGIGTRLVEALLAAARGRIEQIHAAVVIEALPARRLYEKLGFVQYGIEPRGLKVGERAYDQALLVLVLD